MILSPSDSWGYRQFGVFIDRLNFWKTNPNPNGLDLNYDISSLDVASQSQNNDTKAASLVKDDQLRLQVKKLKASGA